MLQIKQICKEYRTGTLVQKALDHVDLSFRDSEFVAILGPSGSGKTTLLNIIGGLDRYDSGDLIINGVSTRRYTDRDWDTYRNHTIGFIFQSYNLIPHQTILANVELTLTVSGVTRAERRRRAVEALEQVGLGKHLNKLPNQLSGGQMQRVAIARALVNDPDILLADEPTGALDSETSVQVMDLLKEVARDRLVIMVTHNPELAYQYATRIVQLSDGVIRTDSDPFTPPDTLGEPVEKKWARRSSMSFLTALALSFQNLRTKKARTLLTSFAGSIGIIGIALILSLSTGVNAYIQTVEEDTLSEYPLSITSSSMDLAGMMAGMMGDDAQPDDHDIHVVEMITQTFSKIGSNDLGSLKEYLDSGQSGIEAYTSAVEYAYSVTPQIYLPQTDGCRQVNPDASFAPLGMGSTGGGNSMMSMATSTNVFYAMPEDADLYTDQYEVKAGRWPQAYNECVLVLTSSGSISDFMLYTLGLRDGEELDRMVEQFAEEETVVTPDDITGCNYEDVLGITFKLVNPADLYQYDAEYGVWRDKTDDDAYMQALVQGGEDLTIVGIVQPAQDATAAMLASGINYPASLTQHVMEQAASSQIVRDQLADPAVNVFTGDPFGEESEEDRFNLEDLFTVDEDILASAFTLNTDDLSLDMGGAFDLSGLALDPSALEGMDLSALDLSSMDLSGMDLSALDPSALDLSGLDLSGLDLSGLDLSGLDLSALLKQIKFTATEDQLLDLAERMLQGYADYTAGDPAKDFSTLGEDFLAYLKTEEAQQNLEDQLCRIIRDSGLQLSAEAVKAMITRVMEGYFAWCEQNGYNPEALERFLPEYLDGEGAQILAEESAKVIESIEAVDITPEQLEALAQSLVDGYSGWAQANGRPDPTRIGEYFLAYLSTPEAQTVLGEGLAAMIDTSGVTEMLNAQMQAMQQSLQQAIQQSMQAVLTQVMEQVMRQVVEQLMSTMMEDVFPAIMTEMMTQFGTAIQTQLTAGMEQVMGQLSDALQNAFQVDSDAFADAIQVNMTEEELSELLMSLMSSETATYEGNLRTLGYADPAEPSSISIYPTDFESKEQVLNILDSYNDRMEASGQEEKVISYTDLVGTLMSSVTDIINIISYVLVAFVAISLVVSSIMIGVITYISVLERKKEIGILRAIGASKGNISQVFNAETFMIGLCAGLIGIGLTLLILIPANAVIHQVANTNAINAVLPAGAAVVLVLLSVVLTLIGGLIPSRKAAKQDPVKALRTE